LLKNSLLKVPEKKMMGFAGEYRFVVRNAQTKEIVRETDWFSNLITDGGLNRMGTNTYWGYCHIGTGTTTPANGDTTLAAPAAYTSTLQSWNTSNSGSPLYETSTTFVYRFNAGALNGNYTEVGIGWSTAALFSRALIVDGGGSPTSVTVASSEYLDVYYRLKVVPLLTDYTYGLTISSVTYSVTRRAGAVSNSNDWSPYIGPILAADSGGATVSAFTGALGEVTGIPSGTVEHYFADATNASYVNNSHTNTGSLGFDLNTFNLPGGIKTILVANTIGKWQHEFTPVLPKDNTKIMTLSFSVTWGRV